MLLHIVNSSLGCASECSECVVHSRILFGTLHAWHEEEKWRKSALHCTDFAFMQKSIINRQYFVWFLIVACKPHSHCTLASSDTCERWHQLNINIHTLCIDSAICHSHSVWFSCFTLRTFSHPIVELHLPANDTVICVLNATILFYCFFSLVLRLLVYGACAWLCWFLFLPRCKYCFSNLSSIVVVGVVFVYYSHFVQSTEMQTKVFQWRVPLYTVHDM